MRKLPVHLFTRNFPEIAAVLVTNRRHLAQASLANALLFAAFGYYLLNMSANDASRNDPPWLAVAFLALAGLSLFAARVLSNTASSSNTTLVNNTASIREDHHDAPDSAPVKLILKTWRLPVLLASFALTAYVLMTIPELNRTDSFLLVFVSWLGSIVSLLLAISPELRRPVLSTWFRRHRRSLFAAAVLIVPAFLLRSWRLGSIPFTLAGDEASQGLEGARVLAGEITNPFTTGWLACQRWASSTTAYPSRFSVKQRWR